jgi:adenylylsulfate kinase
MMPSKQNVKKNLFPSRKPGRKKQREKILGQKGVVLWLTGLSGSGKTTLALAVEQKMLDLGRLAYILDGDNIRGGLNSDLGFGDTDRSENIRRIAEVAALFTDCGVVVITAFISPFRQDRDNARKIIGRKNFIEIFVNAPLNVCENRDTKGLYEKVRKGLINNFTGISSPYEKPVSPDIVIRTDLLSVEKSTEDIMNHLRTKGMI